MMKVRVALAAAAIAALAACGSNNQANNTVDDLNAVTDTNAGMTDLNATDMNGVDLNSSDMNTDADLNSAGAGAGAAGTTNAMGNSDGNDTAPPPGTD